MKKLFGIILLLGACIIPAEVSACQPCVKVYGFEKTARNADVIIRGRKTAEGPRTNPDADGGPDWIEMKVLDVLKGGVSEKSIQVNSFDAMCRYGIILEEGDYIVLLIKRDGAHVGEPYQFDAVNYGCSTHTYRIEKDQVTLEGEKIALKEFIRRLNAVIE